MTLRRVGISLEFQLIKDFLWQFFFLTCDDITSLFTFCCLKSLPLCSVTNEPTFVKIHHNILLLKVLHYSFLCDVQCTARIEMTPSF